MNDLFAIRDVDEKTRRFIHTYARSRRMRTASALKELVGLAKTHLGELKQASQKLKYKDLFDEYEKCKFRADPRLSEKIDDVVYGD